MQKKTQSEDEAKRETMCNEAEALREERRAASYNLRHNAE